MATLEEALYGLNFSPAQTGYGIGQQALAQATPQLINPYGSTGQAIGISLGSVLLQSLLGYQARSQAAQDTLQANTLANQMMSMTTPQARTDFIGGLDDPMQQSRLSTLATALTQQDLARKAEVDLVGGRETAKLKAMGEFYATPEGKAAQEAELAQIKAKAIAGRTPLEEYLAREEARKNTNLAVAALRNEGASERQQKALDAKSGEAGKVRAWKDEQNKANQAFEKNLAAFKIEFGADAAIQKQQRLADLENKLIDEGLDPETRRTEARIAATQEMQSELNIQRNNLLAERQREYNQSVTDRLQLKKQLDAEFPTLTAKVKDDAANANSFNNLAKNLASDIKKISSYPEYRAAKSLSAVGDEQLKSRTIDIADRLTRLRSGMATRGAEDEKLEKIALGDLTVGPQEAASILERLANDTLRVAADKIATQTQKPTDLVNAMRQAAQSNTTIDLQPRIYQGELSQNNAPQVGQSNAPTREDLIAELKRRGVLK
jgi:hypothetical protein